MGNYRGAAPNNPGREFHPLHPTFVFISIAYNIRKNLSFYPSRGALFM